VFFFFNLFFFFRGVGKPYVARLPEGELGEKRDELGEKRDELGEKRDELGEKRDELGVYI
jgi:hypothetical protein